MKRLAVCLALAAAGAAPCIGSGQSGQTEKIEFSNCQSASVVSPNGRWVLEAKFILSACPLTAKITKPTAEELTAAKSGNEWGVSLFLESVSDRNRRRVPFEKYEDGNANGYEGQAAWSPSSAAFFVNNHSASDRTDAAFFLADSLRMISIDDAIFRSDPSTRRYRNEHRYFRALRWLDDHTTLVQLCGHTSEYPAQQFDFRYRVGLDGQAQRISGKVQPVTSADYKLECQ